jgi:hypothetical protein
MANANNTFWNKGNEATPGTASTGFPNYDFKWNNDTDDSNHSEVVSPPIQAPMNNKDSKMILLNTEKADLDNSATYTVTLYGSTHNSSTMSHWEVLDQFVVQPGDIDTTTFVWDYKPHEDGYAPYMKIGIDPSADPGVVTIRAGIVQ